MNKCMLMGRFTKDAEVRYSNEMAIARGTLAVDRRGKDKGTDFISFVAFGKTAEFLEKYGRKGTKFAVEGRIQTGSYENKEGKRIYTTDVVIENIEFAESKKNADDTPNESAPDADEFMSVPDDVADGFPF